MNVLSCFDGMSCGQLALNKLGDIRNIKGIDLPKIDLLLAGSPCFVADTKVLTKNGYKNIQDIVIGDLVLSHTGNWRKVLNVGGTLAPTRIIKIQGAIDIETTDEHPFYVKDILDDTFIAPYWSHAKELDNNTLCSMVSIPINHSPAFYDKWYEIGKSAVVSNNIPIEILNNSIFNMEAFLDGFFQNNLSGIILNDNLEFLLTLQLIMSTVNKTPFYITNDIYSKERNGYYHDIYAWLPVQSNVNTNEIKPVYNIEVEIDNSYTVNNIVVHNCKDLSHANTTKK